MLIPLGLTSSPWISGTTCRNQHFYWLYIGWFDTLVHFLGQIGVTKMQCVSLFTLLLVFFEMILFNPSNIFYLYLLLELCNLLLNLIFIAVTNVWQDIPSTDIHFWWLFCETPWWKLSEPMRSHGCATNQQAGLDVIYCGSLVLAMCQDSSGDARLLSSPSLVPGGLSGIYRPQAPFSSYSPVSQQFANQKSLGLYSF